MGGMTMTPPTRQGEEERCPFAKSDTTPCVNRDGEMALADDGKCVGCGRDAHPRVVFDGQVRLSAPEVPASSPSRAVEGGGEGYQERLDREAEEVRRSAYKAQWNDDDFVYGIAQRNILIRELRARRSSPSSPSYEKVDPELAVQ